MWLNKRHDFSNLKFNPVKEEGERIRTVFCRNKKYIYQTPFKLCDPSSLSEIFSHIKPYLDNYLIKYESFKIHNSPITNSIFKMILFYSMEFKPVDFKNGKLLYEIEIDNKNKNKVLYEYKNTKLIDNNSEKITSFYVNIEVELYNQNKFFQYEGQKEPRIEDLCIICKRNKPNVLITKCFHLVSCVDCLRFNNLYSCPFCYKPFSEIHKVFFAVSRI